MVVTTDNRLRLAPSDWAGLCSFATALLTLVGVTLYQMYDLTAINRERLARFDAEIAHVKADVAELKADVRVIAAEVRR